MKCQLDSSQDDLLFSKGGREGTSVSTIKEHPSPKLNFRWSISERAAPCLHSIQSPSWLRLLVTVFPLPCVLLVNTEIRKVPIF